MQTIQEILQSFMNQPNFSESYQKTVQRILSYEPIQAFVNEHQESLSQTMIQNSLSKLNEFMLEHKAYQQGKDGKNKGYTPILFINQGYIDIAYQPTPEFIQKQKERASRAFIDNRTMSLDVREASMDSIHLNTESRQYLMSAVADFVASYRKNPHATQGLYIAGPFGVGKTYILGALANELAQLGIQVKMVHYPSFVSDAKKGIADNKVQDLLNSVKNPDILMIDDIGAESNSAWTRDELLSVILEYRMKEQLPTFFTSNFSMDELTYHLQETRDGSEKIKALRLMERIKFLAIEFRLDGENLRHQQRGVK